VVSSPGTYEDVQQELITGFYRTSIWLVVVTVDGKFRNPHKKDTTDRVLKRKSDVIF
jgi:hypothetical protein